MSIELQTAWPVCPETLNNEQVASFRAQGYLAFEQVLSAAEVEVARQRITELVQEMANGLGKPGGNGGVLIHPDGRFHVQFEPGVNVQSLDDAGLELKVRKLMSYCGVDPFFGEASQHHRKIQGVLASLLGPGASLFQDMALVKPPRIGSIKPWHQDNAYFSVLPLDQVIGVWIALDPATVENGCMHVIPGGHLNGARRHYHNRDCEIVPDRINEGEAVPIELQAGGALFFYGMLPHQTPPNRSDYRRRALQWHYRGASTHDATQEEFDQAFAEADGSPASCRAGRERS